MAAFQLRTFGDIVKAVREELKVQSTDTTAVERIKRDINMVYSEIISAKHWWWLVESTTLQIPAYHNTGTAFVLQNQSSVIFSNPIGSSKTGYYFALEGDNTVYRIESHAAGSNTLKLSEKFIGASNNQAGYKIWTDNVPLPTNCKATIDVVSNLSRQTLENLGHQDWRKLSSAMPKRAGAPEAYYTSDFVDPSPTTPIASLPPLLTRQSAGVVKKLVFTAALPASLIGGVQIKVSKAYDPTYNGVNFIAELGTTFVTNDTLIYTGKEEHTESAVPDTNLLVEFTASTRNRARYRVMYVYPAISQTNSLLHVDYQKQVAPLEADLDEPIIPADDRIVVVYAALHRAWSRERNPEEAQRNLALYKDKIANMAGQIQDSLDKPIFKPSRLYLSGKRNTFRSRRFNLALDSFFESSGSGGAGGSTVAVLGTPNTVAIFNNEGELEGSSVVSTTELNYLDGATSSIQTQIDTINTYLATAFVTDALVSPTAAIARTKLANGTPDRIVINNGSGVMADSTVTSQELSFLSGVTPLTSLVLNDNQAAPADVFTLPLGNSYCFILYSIKRGPANIEGGFMVLLNDGTNAELTIDSSVIGLIGMALTADVSGANVRLRYTSTNTGIAPNFKYAVIKWAA